MLDWYLVYTKPKNEDLVSQKMTGVGFDVINPKLKERKVYRRKLQDIVSPLFPNYIFVRFDAVRDYRLIKYTRGVRRIVGSQEEGPTPVSSEIIDSIRSRMKDGVITMMSPEIEPGEEVVIKDGPLKGFTAVFEKKLKNAERVAILLTSLNVRAVIDPALLEKSGK